MGYILLIGRALFSSIFLMSVPGHFSGASAAYAAGHGLPMAGLLVPAAGVTALLGGLSILLGYQAKLGGWLIVLFLVPVTLVMHNFWAFPPEQVQQQLIAFKKNLALTGGAIMFAGFGAGPVSIDEWLRRRTESRPSSKD